MKQRLQKFIPGENTRMVTIATFIGIMAGLCNILFRTVVEEVHHFLLRAA